MSVTYTCDRCNYKRSLHYLPRAYVLDSDRTIQMEQRHFWCHTCGEIAVGEALHRNPDILKLQSERLSELRELASLPEEAVDQLRHHERFRAERAVEMMEEIRRIDADWQEWRAVRTSPQKCLRCGSAAPDLPPSELSSFEHGGCGGLLVCTFPISSFNGPAVHAHLYDVDGRFLKQGAKPKRIPGELHWRYEPLELFCDQA
jgi:hypothetical protein